MCSNCNADSNQSVMDFTVVGGQLAHLTKLQAFFRKRKRQTMTDKQNHYQKIVKKLSLCVENQMCNK